MWASRRQAATVLEEHETIEVEHIGGSCAEHARMVEVGELSFCEKTGAEFARAVTKCLGLLG